MPQRITTLLLIAALLPVSMGLAESLHNHGPEHRSDPDQCEICYVLATAAVAVVVVAAMVCVWLATVEVAHATPVKCLAVCNHLTSIAPRAPPVD